MNVTVEILRWADGTNPEVLQTLSHDCHSLDTVIATAQSVVESSEVPANGYRIITEQGVEMYGWAEEHKLNRGTRPNGRQSIGSVLS